MLWIYLSDTALSMLFRDPRTITLVSTLKGALFVLVTSLLLAVLVSRSLRRALSAGREKEEAEKQRAAVAEVLRICNAARTSRDLVHGLVAFFQSSTGCQAVGIRLNQGNDFPYVETHGFPPEFVEKERSLCAKNQEGNPVLECLCGGLLSGTVDTSLPCFTPNGSFWSGPARATVGDVGAARTNPRGRCVASGYASVALLPLRSHGQTLGLLQLNDPRPGLFTAEMVGRLEAQAGPAAIALANARADDALREAAQFSQQIFDSAAEGIVVYDRNLRFARFNPFMEQLTGLSAPDLIGKSPADVFPFVAEQGGLESVRRALQGQAFTMAEMHHHIPQTGRDGWSSSTYAPLRNADGEIIGAIVMVRDITERKRAEAALREAGEKLLQAEKMEAVGRLAGGIAHDFNNILTAIYGYCELLLSRGEREGAPASNGPGEGRADVLEIQKAAQRAASLTQQLLAFSRRQTLRPAEVDLNRLVTDLHFMLRRLIGEHITVELNLEDGLWPVMVDPSRIEQVLVNLAVNARDAMREGGVLRIATENRGTTAIALSVQDTGTGMDDATLPHIFEPFFTTKGPGKGTGLGLSTVYGIVSQSGGTIGVQSAPGRGTTFTIVLPRSTLPAAPPQPAMSEPPGAARGTETVLYVEDDENVRSLMSMVLRGHGYTVIVAADGEEALRLAAPRIAELSLVVSDVVMPHMGGRELATRLAVLKPGLPILFMSGYTEDTFQDMTDAGRSVQMVNKPVNPDKLLRKIREMIDRRAS